MTSKKIFLLLCLILLVSCNSLHAQVPEDNSLEIITKKYREITVQWRPTIYRAAISLFWALALIEMSWTGILMVLNQSDFSAFISEFVVRIFYIGLFLFFLQNSSWIAESVIESFRQIAINAASDTGGQTVIKPSNFFDSGITIIKKITAVISSWSPIKALGYMIACMIIVVCYAMIGASLIVASVEMYLVINAGFILLGFGPNRYTRDIAVSYLRHILSVGVKLFTIHLIIAIGEKLVHGWVDDFTVISRPQALLAIAHAVIFWYLIKEIPAITSGLVSGVSFSSGGGLAGSASEISRSVTKLAQTFSGAAMAINTALKAAGAGGQQQGLSPLMPAPHISPLAKMTGIAGEAGKKLAGAVKENIAEKLSKRTFGGQLSQKIAKPKNPKDGTK